MSKCATHRGIFETLCSCILRYICLIRSIILRERFQLADLLIKPIQRIQKYHLLMKKILSYTELANCPAHVIASLNDAMKCSAIIPKNANNMMDVGRLQGFTVRLTAQQCRIYIILCTYPSMINY